jgi:hypothetical protein
VLRHGVVAIDAIRDELRTVGSLAELTSRESASADQAESLSTNQTLNLKKCLEMKFKEP